MIRLLVRPNIRLPIKDFCPPRCWMEIMWWLEPQVCSYHWLVLEPFPQNNKYTKIRACQVYWESMIKYIHATRAAKNYLPVQ